MDTQNTHNTFFGIGPIVQMWPSENAGGWKQRARSKAGPDSDK